jgi:hypothetical protein
MKRLSFLFLAAAAAAFAQCPNEAASPWAYVPASGYFVSVNAAGSLVINQCAGGAVKVIYTAPKFADAETPTGALNGTNRTFVLTHPPASPALVTLNGLVQRVGADYSLTGATLSFLTAPRSGDLLQVWYRY